MQSAGPHTSVPVLPFSLDLSASGGSLAYTNSPGAAVLTSFEGTSVRLTGTTAPHLGIALGFDRLLMLLTGEDSIREIIAFPKTTSSLCLLTGSPSAVSQRQLDELGIAIKK